MLYLNRLKLNDTIEERHGLHGMVPVSDLVEMNQTNFAPTDIFVTPVNETNVVTSTNDYHLKIVIGTHTPADLFPTGKEYLDTVGLFWVDKASRYSHEKLWPS